MKLGDLNGPWSVLTRVAIAGFPVVVAAMFGFGAHVVTRIDAIGNRITRLEAERFAHVDAIALERRLDDKLHQFLVLIEDTIKQRNEALGVYTNNITVRFDKLANTVERHSLLIERLIATNEARGDARPAGAR